MKIKITKRKILLNLDFLAVFFLMAGLISPTLNVKAATVDAALMFDNSAPTVASGVDFDLVARVNPGSNISPGVNAVDFRFTFDASVLSINSITVNSAAFTQLSAPVFDNVNGTATVVVFTTVPVIVTTDVATVSFHAISAAVDSSVTITNESDATVDDGNGTKVVSTRTPSLVDITGIDAIAPVVTAFDITEDTHNDRTVSIGTFEADDAVGVSAYLINESSADPAVDDVSWGAKPTEYTFASDGNKTLYAWAKDAAGNISVSLSDAVLVDTAAPVVTLSAPADGSRTSDNTPLLTYSVSDGTVVVKVDDVVVSKVSGNSLDALSEGSHTVSVEATDSVGNATTVTNTFTVDTAAPLVTLSAPADGSRTSDNTPLLTYSVSDGTVVVKVDDVVVSKVSGNSLDALSEGSHTVSVEATDLTGNATTITNTFTVDTVAPTISSVSSDKVAGTYKAGDTIDIDVNFSEAVTSSGNVTVTLETGTTDRTCSFAVTNSLTGTCDYIVQAGDSSLDLDTVSISGSINDQAGNAMTNFVPTTGLAASEALVIDTASPTGGSFVIDEGVETITAAINLSITCPTDTWAPVEMAFGNSASPTNWISCAANTAHTLVGANGTKTVYMRFRDGGGNTTADLTNTILLNAPDTSAPVISNGKPSGTLSYDTIEATLEVSTDETAECRYSTISNTDYDSMTEVFDSTSSTSHSSSVNGLSANNSYTYYVKCADALSNKNSSDYVINFSVDSEPVEEVPSDQGEEIEIPKPTVRLEDDKQSLTSYFRGDKKIRFSGKLEQLAGGKVRLKSDGKTKDTNEIRENGKWDVSVKLDESEIVKIYFYNADGEKMGSKKYRIKVDAEDPVFTEFPMVLNKKVGDRIWWKATDNKEIDHYKYVLYGRVKNTKEEGFNIPSYMPKGPHGLKVSAYDKAGNKTTKNVLLWIW